MATAEHEDAAGDATADYEHEPTIETLLQIDGNVSLSSNESLSDDPSTHSNHQTPNHTLHTQVKPQAIPLRVTNNRPTQTPQAKYPPQNLVILKRSNKFGEALTLPKICNINPQSVYNKRDEFITFVQQMEADVIFMSESWERPGQTLDVVLEPLQDHTVVSNVHQRQGRGGRPALIVNTKKYHIQNITQSVISIPWGVEVVWVILSPKEATSTSTIQKIVCGSIYQRPQVRSHGLLLDHITDVYNILTSKYPRGLHWILAGDTNKMKLDTILSLDTRLKQIVQTPTRLNPPEILDPVLMTLSKYYTVPVCLPPLDSDNGETQSDHLTVWAEPISAINNKPARITRKVKVRRLPQSGKDQLRRWISQQTWDEVLSAESAHEQAMILQTMLMQKVDEYLPEKMVSVSSDDQPWFTPELKELDKKRKTEYRRHRKSARWRALNKSFKTKVAISKEKFYKRRVEDFKEGNPGQWYSLLKRLCSADQLKSEQPECEEIKDKSDQEQAELIADRFAAVSNEYSPVDADKISIPAGGKPPPKFTPLDVLNQLMKLKAKKATAPEDIPSALIRENAEFICVPLSHILNTCVARGEYPRVWKIEAQTPIPKEYPVLKIEMLRNISILKNFNKVAETLLSKVMVGDMKEQMDKSQYGNCKGVSVQHYLMKMLDKILSKLDNNGRGDTFAVIASMIDWKQAFPRQCPTLGVQSWIDNGVRPSLVPILTDFFRDRVMRVRWHGVMSSERALSGGGPQGSTLGLLEYLSQSNDNTDSIPQDMKYKWLDDLTVLEVINLLTIGISSYNIKDHIPSDIVMSNGFIEARKLKTQIYMNSISEWTTKKEMKLNHKKSSIMVFNFTEKYQFSTRLTLENEPLETVEKCKLLGVVITNDLKWNENTKYLIKRANARMEILRKLSSFNPPISDMVTVYILYIRSILEQSCTIWHSTLTEENKADLERVQKNACRNILKDKYKSYTDALKFLKLETLEERREKLILKFGKQCIKLEQTKELFPLKTKIHGMNTRSSEVYEVFNAHTQRYRNSTVPYIQRILNKENQRKRLPG